MFNQNRRENEDSIRNVHSSKRSVPSFSSAERKTVQAKRKGKKILRNKTEKPKRKESREKNEEREKRKRRNESIKKYNRKSRIN